MYRWLTTSIWSVPLAVAYLYAAAASITLGYLTYFNVPTNFLEVSLRSNVLFVLSGPSLIALLLTLKTLITVCIAALIITVVYFVIRNRPYFGPVSNVFVLIVLFLVLYGLNQFGYALAAGQKSLYAPTAECKFESAEIGYVIPAFFDKAAILIPYEKETKMLKGGFRMQALETLGCTIDYTSVGPLDRRPEW